MKKKKSVTNQQVTDFLSYKRIHLFLLQQMFQILIACDAFQLVLNNLLHFLLDAPVIRLHRFLHTVVAVLVREIGNEGYLLIGFLFPLHLFGIHDNWKI